MPIPTALLVVIYAALILALAVIVRRAHVRFREGHSPHQAGLEQQIRFPYSPPRERRTRAYDWRSGR